MSTAITCTFLYMPVYQSSQLFVPYLKCCCWLKLLSKYFGRRKCLFSWSSLAVIDFQLLVFGNYSFFFFFNAISTISNLAHTSFFFFFFLCAGPTFSAGGIDSWATGMCYQFLILIPFSSLLMQLSDYYYFLIIVVWFEIALQNRHNMCIRLLHFWCILENGCEFD